MMYTYHLGSNDKFMMHFFAIFIAFYLFLE